MCGARMVWHQLRREGIEVACFTVEGLMRRMSIRGIVRGKKPRTTTPDKAAARSKDLVERTSRTLEKCWTCGVRDPRLGLLVQQSTVTRTDRLYPAR